MAIHHASEKLQKAVNALAVGVGPIKQRLADVTELVMQASEVPGLPPDFEAEYDALRTRLAAVESASDEEACSIANDILSLASKAEHLINR